MKEKLVRKGLIQPIIGQSIKEDLDDLYPDWFLHTLAFQYELLFSPQHCKWSQSSWLIHTSSGFDFIGCKWCPCSALVKIGKEYVVGVTNRVVHNLVLEDMTQKFVELVVFHIVIGLLLYHLLFYHLSRS